MQWWILVGLSLLVLVATVAWQQGETAKGEEVKETPSQFVSVFSVEVEQGHAQEFIERFQKRARLIDKAKGFKGLFVIQHTQEGNKFLVVTFWENEKSFHDWVNSEEFRKAHAQGGVPTKAMKLDTYRIVVR